MFDHTVRRIFARRAGRVVFGATLIAFAVAVLVMFAVEANGPPTWTLLAAWPTATALGLLGWAGAAGSTRTFHAPPLAGAPHAPVSAAATTTRFSPMSRRLARLERPALLLPLVGMTLLLPLTAHLLAAATFLALPRLNFGGLVFDFSKWIAMSAVLVGHAHLLLAARGARLITKLLRGERVEVVRWSLRSVGWATLLACVPGGVLIGIPPFLVAVTGVVVVPPIWLAAAAIHNDERARLRGLVPLP